MKLTYLLTYLLSYSLIAHELIGLLKGAYSGEVFIFWLWHFCSTLLCLIVGGVRISRGG